MSLTSTSIPFSRLHCIGSLKLYENSFKGLKLFKSLYNILKLLQLMTLTCNSFFCLTSHGQSFLSSINFCIFFDSHRSHLIKIPYGQFLNYHLNIKMCFYPVVHALQSSFCFIISDLFALSQSGCNDWLGTVSVRDYFSVIINSASLLKKGPD